MVDLIPHLTYLHLYLKQNLSSSRSILLLLPDVTRTSSDGVKHTLSELEGLNDKINALSDAEQ